MRRFKEIRIRKKLKLIEAAQKLGVSQPTLSSWESGRKSPSLDMLLQMSELYEVTTDYLLGKEVSENIKPEEKISVALLATLHEKPVWVQECGWALVNAVDKSVLFADGESLAFSDIGNAVLIPSHYTIGDTPHSLPLPISTLPSLECFWVEPISKDSELRQSLRGRYKIINGFAENDCGSRFSLSSYGATWLAFEITE